MKRIIFYQTPYNTVEFLTSSNSEEKDMMSYYDFLQFIYSEIKVQDINEFVLNLDSFKTILLYDTGEWELIEEEQHEYSFEEMYEANVNKEEKKSTFDETLNKSKNYLNSLFSFRKQNRRY